jgi:hypothetical protein
MGLRFTVLASGSCGNASLVEAEGCGILIDVGLGPRQLGARLAAAGRSWSAVQAVLLTHTHTDHWKDRSLAEMHQRGILLYCHLGHHAYLNANSSAFGQLLAAGLVHPYESGEDFNLTPSLRCRPLPIRHDGGPTFGFRLEGTPDLFGPASALAYAADLGCWDDELADHLADVDLLALEFNHDVAMEVSSGRLPMLIARVLGDEGHLSNDQAASLVRAVLTRSAPGRLRHLVQLHLSLDCNRSALAREAALPVIAEMANGAEVHTASQDEPGATLHLGAGAARKPSPRRARRRTSPAPLFTQRWLPGLEEEESRSPYSGD